MNMVILLPIGVPILVGMMLWMSSFAEHFRKEKKKKAPGNRIALYAVSILLLTACAAAAVVLSWTGDRQLTLTELVDGIPLYFYIDDLGKLFITVVSVIWVLTSVYCYSYLKEEGADKRFLGCFLALYGVLVGLCFAGNLVTMYLFYELMTLVSTPLVMHNRSREAILAGLKYLFFSLCGAYAGLFGIFVLNRYCDTLVFLPGGSLSPEMAVSYAGILQAAVFVMLIGFGAKAGMLPLHAWLPTAHPVAPSPASAVLSGVIVKFGVFAMIRVVCYVVGTELIRGTWVQTVWMILSLCTVFMGSMLAFREPVFKKRLAYSTVSQLSYIVFGLSLLNPAALTGALLHVVGHAVIKCGLFLTAGVFLSKYGCTKVSELSGIGKKQPKVLWCYTVFALGLIGMPFTAGFVSKWNLAVGSLTSKTGVFAVLGPIVLLISALLTAGYLLPVTMHGFFPGESETAGRQEKPEKERTDWWMLLPLLVLAVLTVLLGTFPGKLVLYFEELSGLLIG